MYYICTREWRISLSPDFTLRTHTVHYDVLVDMINVTIQCEQRKTSADDRQRPF